MLLCGVRGEVCVWMSWVRRSLACLKVPLSTRPCHIARGYPVSPPSCASPSPCLPPVSHVSWGVQETVAEQGLLSSCHAQHSRYVLCFSGFGQRISNFPQRCESPAQIIISLAHSATLLGNILCPKPLTKFIGPWQSSSGLHLGVEGGRAF